MQNFRGILFLGFLIIAGAKQARSVPACPFGHCSAYVSDSECQAIADELKMPLEVFMREHGGKVMTRGYDNKLCSCPCSCVVAETFIGVEGGYKFIPQIKRGELVMTPVARQKLSSVDLLHYSKMEELSVLKTEFSNGQSIISSPNHTFITPDEKVVAADKLERGTKVLGADGTAIEVLEKPVAGFTQDALYNLSVNRKSNNPADHVIDTNGVLSGDWVLQSNNDIIEEAIFLRTTVLKAFLEKQE